MIIDNEFVGALRRFVRGFEVNEETLAFDLIKEVGPGGCFLNTDHTVRHFRAEQWEPEIFSRQQFSAWMQSGSRSDVDIALDIYRDIQARPDPPTHISDDTEKALLDIIERSTGLRIDPVSWAGQLRIAGEVVG
jgi:trimethylamine--corrinoid protein Co-methyltransferase